MKISNLINLGKKILELFEDYISIKDPKPQMRTLVRHFTTNLKITETGCQTTGSSEIIQKKDWTFLILDFINERIKSLNDLKQLAKSIAICYNNNIDILAPGCNKITQTSYWLESFIYKIIHEKLEGKLSEDSLIDHASLFKSELELAPIEYQFIHYISGIFLEPNSIKINNKVCIRKIKESDLEYTSELLVDFPKSRKIPSSILKINMSAQDQNECFEYVNNIFNSLRLYKVGSILSLETKTVKKTIIWSSAKQLSWSGDEYFSFNRYPIHESHVNTFIKFVNSIVQKLYFDKKSKIFWSLGIALDRYNSALLEKTDSDRRLMISVMGLESLFSLPKERGENAFKLSNRVAKLLGTLNFNVEKVRMHIQQAYIFRNKVVHGLYITQNKRNEMNEVLPEILNYLRISIIIFLLNKNIGKDKLIIKIDNSLIDGNQSKDLNKLIDKTTKDFKEHLCEL
ncbi:MAG: hypothetical protein V3V33_05360 [Candidatus Lokiarchaeia archaeon]